MKQAFFFITLILWGTLIGAITYSHIVYFPPYLGHLPASTTLLKGPYSIHDENFWMMIHPVLILSLGITLAFNWKLAPRRRYILLAMGIYAIAIIATFLYFVPELKSFATSDQSNISAEEWLQRGNRWQYMSWIRGLFMYFGFLLLLIGLTKNGTEKIAGTENA